MQTRNEDIVGQAIVEGVKILYPVGWAWKSGKGVVLKEKRGKVFITLVYPWTLPVKKWVSPKRCLIVSY